MAPCYYHFHLRDSVNLSSTISFFFFSLLFFIILVLLLIPIRTHCTHFEHLRTFPDNVLKQPKNVLKRPQMSAIAYRPPITQETYNGAPLTMLVS